MGNNIRSSSRPKALAPSVPMPPLADAMDAVHLSVDRFCLLAGVEALAEMMEEDATTVCGARHRRHGDRRGYRWGRTHSEIGYHGGKVKVARPRVRDRAGKEVSLESWQALRDGNLLLEWALNLMVLNVSTRKYHRAVRLPEGDLAKARGDGTSKSAVSRHHAEFKADVGDDEPNQRPGDKALFGARPPQHGRSHDTQGGETQQPRFARSPGIGDRAQDGGHNGDDQGADADRIAPQLDGANFVADNAQTEVNGEHKGDD